MAVLVYIVFVCYYLCTVFGEQANEDLLVKDLGNGFTAFHFNFVTKVSEYDFSSNHYDLLPRPLVQTIKKYNVAELHLSISKGLWYDNWGTDFVMTSPSGAELWIWFKNNTDNVNEAWSEVTHSLSGLFCASLNKLSTQQHFSTPFWSFRPHGLTEHIYGKPTGHLRYAQLPDETLCSENVTPWAKFLPCKRLSGIGYLLKPTSLFKASYNSLAIGMRKICLNKQCSLAGYEFLQTLTLVFDRRFIYGDIKLTWTISGLLGLKYKRNCEPVKSSHLFYLDSNGFSNVQTDGFNLSTYSDKRVLFSISTDQFVHVPISSLKFTPNPMNGVKSDKLPLVSVDKYVTGHGNVRGGVKILLTNRAEFSIKSILLDYIPWYTETFFNTLKIYVLDSQTSQRLEIFPDQLKIKPSMSNKRMGSLEMILILPAKHQVIVTYEFRKALLHWNAYPPDANHGFYLPHAVVSYRLTQEQQITVQNIKGVSYPNLALPNWATSYDQLFDVNNTSVTDQSGVDDGFVRIYTPVSLITMPTPDFSMPFNVLCIVCSIISLIFGSIHKSSTNLVTALLPKSKKSNWWHQLKTKMSYMCFGVSPNHVEHDKKK